MTYQSPYETALANIELLTAAIAARLADNAADEQRLADWRAAARVFAPEGAAASETSDSGKPSETEMDNAFRTGSLKSYFFSVLANPGASVWQTANEVQASASELKGSPIPMSSVSPTLSDMKEKGYIVRDGLKVALKSRAGMAPSHQASDSQGGLPV